MIKMIVGFVLLSVGVAAHAGPCFIKIKNNDARHPETRMVNVENIVSISSNDMAVYVYVSPIGMFKVNVTDSSRIPVIMETLRFEAENCSKLK